MLYPFLLVCLCLLGTNCPFPLIVDSGLRGPDTLAWATGTRVGTGDHAIALFCIEYGCVLGLYSDTLHFEV